MTSSKSVTTSIVPPIDRIVIVGASLAGLRAAEAFRDEGFTGHITLIGDEPFEPYDRRFVDFDRLLIATGTRARPWVSPEEAVLDGVFTPARTGVVSAPA